MERRRAVWLMVLAVVLFSSSGVLIKLSTLNALAITGGRSAVAAGVILIFLRGRPRLKWSPSLIGGAVAYIGSTVFFVAATQLTTAANAILLQFTAPIYVALFGIWFLHERARRIDWITMGLIGLGMLLFFSDDLAPTGYLGNLYAICSGICLAWLVLFLRKQQGAALETLFLGNVLAALIGLPFLIQSTPTSMDWAVIFALGTFQLAVPFVLYAYALRYLEAIEAILIQALEPILNPIWVYMVLDEAPSARALAGGALVLTAIVTRGIAAGRRKPEVAAQPPAPASPTAEGW